VIRLSATTLAVTDATATGAAAAETVSDASPVFDSIVARMTAVPGATAVTTPAIETVATFGLSELHATYRPDSTFPLASRATADACVVCPGARLVEPRLVDTIATGGGTTVIVPSPV
jgi:hypothetical protein